jgi:hypothetical protein
MKGRSKDTVHLVTWQEELAKVKKCSPRQDSLTSQLTDLIIIANKFGLYDAADAIQNLGNP